MIRLNILEFMKEYKNKWINYCEIIIDNEGKIIIINPSHTITMQKLTNRSEDDIYAEMPIIASPIHWFVDYLKYVAVWYEFLIVPKEMTKKQEKTLEILSNHKFIRLNLSVVRDCDLGILNKR